jgi:NADPH-dependent 2,4-dienoyl-CoA reductase/sulfur reductase-like enzyme
MEGDDIFAEDEAIPSKSAATKNEDQRTFLLVGVGAASTMTAATLRLEGFGGRIVTVDPVQDEPVDRTQLSKMALSGKKPLEKMTISEMKEAEVERIESAVTHFSAAKQEAKLADGRTIAFDAALVATGGKPKRLDIAGAEHAFTIRHVDDVRKLLAAVAGKREVLIIGTSFIGLEAASALAEKGLHVTVLGQDELPFAKKFGEEVAQAIKKLHESKNTDFYLGLEITSIDSEGVHAKSRKLNKSISFRGDVVIMGVGVEPELGFEHDLPLAEKGGIRTGSDLKAAENVWVAGDIANVDGTRIEHWRLAEQHGQIVARQMLGGSAHYDSVPFFWTFHHGKRLAYLGHANEWDEIVYEGSVEGLAFIAYYMKDGKVAAILSCGRDTDTAMLAEVMRSKPTLEEARKSIAN